MNTISGMKSLTRIVFLLSISMFIGCSPADKNGTQTKSKTIEQPVNLTKGIDYRYFELTPLAQAHRLEQIQQGDENSSVADLSQYQLIKHGQLDSISLDIRDRDQFYAFQYQGFIHVETAATYTFYLKTQGLANFAINDDVIIENPAEELAVENQHTITLTAGQHAFSLEYFNDTAQGAVDLYLSSDDLSIAKASMPASMLYATPPEPEHYLPAASSVPETTTGLKYQYFEGSVQQLSNLDQLTAVKEGYIQNISLELNERDFDYAIKYQGYLSIPSDGYYTFYINTLGFAEIILGERSILQQQTTVLENSKNSANTKRQSSAKSAGTEPTHATPELKTVTQLLRAGLHEFVLVHRPRDEASAYTASYRIAAAKMPVQDIPQNWFYQELNDENVDTDGDGVIDNEDAFPNDPDENSDIDGDGIGDNSDTDIDGDGVDNEQDLFPNDPDETSDLDGDGIGDNSDTDIDGDGVDNEQDAFPNDPDETGDLDGDGIGDNSDNDLDGDGILNDVDEDIDGDGITNEQDIYPYDATRSRLESINELTVNLHEQALLIAWQPATNGESNSDNINDLVDTYTIFRSDYSEENLDLENYSKVATVSKNELSYKDTTVENNRAYSYYVAAQTAKQQQGLPSDLVSAFVAYNKTKITNLVSTQVGTKVQLSWSENSSDEVHIYRAVNESEPVFINTVQGHRFDDINIEINTHSDTSTHSEIYNSYHYQLVPRRHFVNPITDENFSLDGPISAINSITMAKPLVLKLNALLIASDSYQLFSTENTQMATLVGHHLHAGDVVDMTFSTTGRDSDDNAIADIRLRLQASLEGDFTIDLPKNSTNQWTITSVSGSQKTVASLNIVFDAQGPSIYIDGRSNFITSAFSIRVSGTVTDEQGIDSIVLSSDSYPGKTFTPALITNSDGSVSFSAEIPIEIGVNIIAVTAIDNAGNLSSAHISAIKKDTTIPVIEITSHRFADVVNQPELTLVGLIHSQAPFAQLSVFLGEQSTTLVAIDDGSYQFTFSDIILEEGTNTLTLVAKSPAGDATVNFKLSYQPDVVVIAPDILIKSPTIGSYISDQSFVLQGEIYSSVAITSFTINEQSVYLSRLGDGRYHFNYSVEFIDASIELTLKVINENEEHSSETIHYYRDNSPPVISISNNLHASPEVNKVKQIPYYLSGSVVDENLSSLTLNGNVVELIPGASNNQYLFNLAVSIENRVETPLTLNAYDLSGNMVSQEFIIMADSLATIELIAPSGKTDFITQGDTFELQVIARTHGLQASDKVSLTIDQNNSTFVEVTDGLINTAMVISGRSGEHSLTLEIINAAAEVVSATSQVFSLTNADDIPLNLVKTAPANGQQGVEPHQAIELYVNKAIDPTKLHVEVRETANGQTYVNQDESGEDFLAAKGYQLVDINRNNELVPGGIGLIPGDNVFTFYPERDLAYGGNIFVSVTYDGTELTRFNYGVRELPTFLTGIVFDQLSQPISGIKVELPALGRVTTTDNEGVFNFGAGDSANNTLPAGSHQLVINNNFNNPVFGVTDRTVVIEKGRHSQLSKIIVPMLNKEQAFTLLETGKNHLLARAELSLDLTNAQLTFPDNSHSGLAQVSFVNISEADVTPTPEAFPLSLYTFQPAGIKVSGAVSLSIKMLKIYNSYHYVPASGSYVVLVGRKGTSNAIQPIGVGQIDGYTINSIGKVDMNTLDYIGYALVEESKQGALQQYADGQISIQALIGAL